jgi:hypothetical protein
MTSTEGQIQVLKLQRHRGDLSDHAVLQFQNKRGTLPSR